MNGWRKGLMDEWTIKRNERMWQASNERAAGNWEKGLID